MATVGALIHPDYENVQTSRDMSSNQRPPTLADFRPNDTLRSHEAIVPAYGGMDLYNNNAQTRALDIGEGKNIEALCIPGILTDWYNRIHFIPSEIALGGVPSYRESDFQIWNAYLNSELIYEWYSSSETDGLDIDGDVISAFNPLEVRDYTLEVSADGDPTIDSTLTFVFNAESPTLPVSGVRVSFLAFWPQTDSQESLESMTWIFTSKDGTEQRSRSRSRPVQKIKQRLLLTLEQWRTAQNLIYGQVGRRWAVIHAGEASILRDVNFAINDTDLDFRTDFSEYWDGGLCVVYKDPDNYHLASISSVNSNGLTLATPFQAAMTGDVLVAPVYIGKDPGSIVVDTDPAGNHTVKMDYTVYEGAPDLTGQVEDTYYNNYAYISRENEGRNVQRSFVQNQYMVKSDFGVPEWGSRWDASKSNRAYKWTLNPGSEYWWWKLFYWEHQGNVPFWVPSFEADLALSSDLGGGTFTFTVTDADYRLSSSSQKNHVRIIHADGTEDLREVVSTADGGSGTTICTIDQATTNLSTEAAADVEIQFLSLVRHEGPVKVNHHGYKTIVSFNLKEVQQ